MTSEGFRFDRFLLEPGERRLTREGVAVELSGRYLDALALLVREQGSLVSKDRFLDEVWRGVPVTDEALTQCVRTLRRRLGDDAARPRFIETVPRHGYRFIAPVEARVPAQTLPPQQQQQSLRDFLLLGVAGAAGGSGAGFLGGLFYGFAASIQPLQGGPGAVSILLVLLVINTLIGAAGGAGVGFGIAAANLPGGREWWRIAGGALGGLLVGAAVKLLGLDAFGLLFGRAPGGITGAGEGVLLGGAIGFGAFLAFHGAGPPRLRRAAAAAGLAGGGAGLLIALLGGRLMGGSLDLLARHFPDSRLRLDGLGALFGETGFGPVTRAATSMMEGLLFGACLVAAMAAAQRRRRTKRF